MLGEDLALTGTGVALHYDSKRVRGRATSRRIRVQVAGPSLPASLLRIEASASIAGRTLPVQHIAPTPDAVYQADWDGLDAYGRLVQGREVATVTVGYVYQGQYGATSRFGSNGNGIPITGDRARQELTFWSTVEVLVGQWDAYAQKMGGWNLSNHHAYDVVSKTLYLGNGDERQAKSIPDVTKWLAGQSVTSNFVLKETRLPAPILFLDRFWSALRAFPDGSAVVKGNTAAATSLIRLLGPDGDVSIIAGGPNAFSPPGPFAEGGLATSANVRSADLLHIGPDDSVYFTDLQNYTLGYRIRKITPAGIITTVVGGGVPGNEADGMSATAGWYQLGSGFLVDPNGTIYFDADYAGGTIRAADPSGVLRTIVGGGLGFAGDGGPAISAKIGSGTIFRQRLAMGKDGSLFIADPQNRRIRRVTPNGRIDTVVGGGTKPFGTQGVPATDVTMGTDITDITVGPDGALYFVEAMPQSPAVPGPRATLRRVGSDGLITTVMGGTSGWSREAPPDGSPARSMTLHGRYTSIAFRSDGTLLLHIEGNIFHVTPALPSFWGGGLGIASEDGSELYEFAADGRHIQTRNTLTGAIATKFEYQNGLLVREIDGDGNVLTIQRNSNGTATAIVAPGGQTTQLAMDANGYLASATDPGGHAHQFSYGASGLMASHTTPKGDASTYTYDALGRLTKDADPQGGFISVDASDLTSGVDIVVTTAEGRVSQRQLRNLPDGSQQQRFVSPAGAVTLVTRGANGSQVTLLPDGMTMTATLGADPRWGMQAPLTKSETVTTPGGRTYIANATRTATLATAGQPLSLLSQVDTLTINGDTFASQFNAATRNIVSTTAMGRQAQATLDPQARLASLRPDPAIDPLTVTRNARGQVSELAQGTERSVFDYNPISMLLSSVRDAQSNQFQFQYTGADLLRLLTAPDGGQYQYDHDANDNVTALTMPSGDTHNFAHDKIDQPTTYTPPSNPPAVTSYNLDRQVQSVQLPTGRTLATSFDTAGRPTQLVYPQGNVQIAYVGPTDRVQSISSSVGGPSQTNFVHDGPLITEATMSGVSTGRYRYRYDNKFQLVGYTLDDNPEVAVGRDRDGRVTQHGQFTYTRGGPGGAVSRISNGTLSIDYTYTGAGRLWTRTHTVAGQQLYRIELTHDSVGQLSKRIETIGGTSHTFDYTYDPSKRLKTVQVDGTTTERYDYDKNGNRTSRQLGTGPTEIAGYDGQDRLKTRGSIAYQFNDDGQMTHRGADTFQVSARSELTSVTSSGGATITYGSDAAGFRISRTDGAGTVQYLYGLGGALVSATRSSSGVTQLFYDELAGVFAFQRNGTTHYVATDQVGTPRVTTDGTGAVVRIQSWDSFGVATSDSNPNFEFPLGFAGGVADPATGLTRFGFRDYEAASGRWTAKDPTGFSDGPNLYSYVDSQPTSLRDPFGLTKEEEDKLRKYAEELDALRKLSDAALDDLIKNPDLSDPEHATRWNRALNERDRRNKLKEAEERERRNQKFQACRQLLTNPLIPAALTLYIFLKTHPYLNPLNPLRR